MTTVGRNLIITGFMASGKTTVGKLVAGLLHRQFVDTDDLIVAATAMTIPQIFASRGESGFRAMEAELCHKLSEPQSLVIATGGGTLITPFSRESLQRGGLVVCLDVGLEVLEKRLATACDRPLARCNWRDLWARRQNAYGAITVHIITDGKSPQTVAEEIVRL